MFYLSDEELTSLLELIDQCGQKLAAAETNFKASEREIKLVYAAIASTLKESVKGVAALEIAVTSSDEYSNKIIELRGLQLNYLKAKAKKEHLDAIFEAWRTHSANVRMST